MQKSNGRGRSSNISPEMKDARLTVLHTLCERMQEELPGIYFQHSRESKDRLLLQWRGDDYFNFYFSNKIRDGFRFAFVVDLDHKRSIRRKELYTILSGTAEEIAQALECSSGDGIGDERLMKEG